MADSNTTRSDAATQVSFLTSEARDLTTYWQSLVPSDGGIPARADFDPIAVPGLLSSLLIIERLHEETYKIRLQGTGFEGRGIDDWTGQVWEDDKLDPDNRSSFGLFREVLDTPCGLRVVGIEKSNTGRLLRFEGAGFPLADANGVPRFIVCTVAPIETVGYETDAGKQQTIQDIESREILPITSGKSKS